MKANLQFDIPEEESGLRYALDGLSYAAAVTSTLAIIRSKLKHGHPFKTPDEALEFVRDYLADETANLWQE